MGKPLMFWLVILLIALPAPVLLAQTESGAASSVSQQVGASLESRLTKLEQQAADAKSSADNAWMLTSSALVLMMTGPGLALFYGGLVRKKNVLGTM